jgi:hypothetical protein
LYHNIDPDKKPKVSCFYKETFPPKVPEVLDFA